LLKYTPAKQHDDEGKSKPLTIVAADKSEVPHALVCRRLPPPIPPRPTLNISIHEILPNSFSAWQLPFPPSLDLSKYVPSIPPNPITLPKEIDTIKSKMTKWSRSSTSSGSTTFYDLRIGVIWTKNLSRSLFKITWENENSNINVQRRDTLPPLLLKVDQLISAHKAYGQRIVDWCTSQVGRQVNRGECWDLANQALLSIPGVMTAHEYIFGHIIYERIYAGEVTRYEQVRPGDIVQYASAKFQWSGGSSATGPDHTAVVEKVEGKGTLHVLEQNVNGIKRVVRGETELANMVSGEIRIYRAVSKEWCGGDLHCQW